MIRKFLSFVFMLFAFFATSQEKNSPIMADKFREDGKIYVVIAVLSIIFLSIIFLLIYIERKLKKIEKKIENL